MADDGDPLRDDDKPEVIRKRLETYHEKTKPLVGHYEKAGLLRRLEASRSPDEVARDIQGLLATLRMEQDA